MPRLPKLHKHATGQWRARIHGRDHYYGTDYIRATARFNQEVAAAYGTANVHAEEATIAHAIVAFQALHPDREWHREMARPLAQFAGLDRLRDLPTHFLTDYANWLKSRNLAPQTLRHYMHTARQTLRVAREKGWLTQKLEVPQLPRPVPRFRDLPSDRLRVILASCDRSRPRVYGALVRFMLYTGARPGEAMNLRWEQVNLGDARCVLDTHKTAHQGRVRVLYLTPPALALLHSLGPSTGPVFHHPDGRAVVGKSFAGWCRRRGFYPYQLRHSFAQQARGHGIALDELQVLLGHARISMTQTYAQVRSDQAAAAAQRLDLSSALAPPAAPNTQPPP